MALDLASHEARACEAVRAFWASHERGAAGTAIGGFIDLLTAVVGANGLADANPDDTTFVRSPQGAAEQRESFE